MFNTPNSIAVDPKTGIMYVSDGHNIRRITASGNYKDGEREEERRKGEEREGNKSESSDYNNHTIWNVTSYQYN